MYQSTKLEFAIIYGQRRVGKTTLITEFCRNKKTIFYATQKNSVEQNLAALSHAIAKTNHNSSATDILYCSFSDTLTRIAEISGSDHPRHR